MLTQDYSYDATIGLGLTPRFKEMGPNAEMSQAQDMPLTTETPVVSLTQRLASLDMSPTAEEAYEQAILTEAHVQSMGDSKYDQSGQESTVAVRGDAPGLVVSSTHHEEFLRLLARFHQAVAPLPKSIAASFTRPSDSGRLHDAADPENRDRMAPLKGKTATSSPLKSRIHYQPSKSYAKPTDVRRRTTSAPSPATALIRKTTSPATFDDMESLLRHAQELMQYMRDDVEEVRKKWRNKDRAHRERARPTNHGYRSNSSSDDSEDEDDAPLVRKVPVGRSVPWYSPSGSPPVQDSNVSSTLHVAPRKIITPARLKSRRPMAPDALDKCTSKLTGLKLQEPLVISSPETHEVEWPTSPIRMYSGYMNQVRPQFVFGTDVVSTCNYIAMDW